jgi:hypothetical protein
LLFLLGTQGARGQEVAGGRSVAPCRGLWVCAEEVRDLPMEGAAWRALAKVAASPTKHPRLADQDDDTDVQVLAKALVYARTGDETLRRAVIEACMAAMGTEAGGKTLALGRNLIGYVIAADVVGLPPEQDAVFRAWLKAVRDAPLDGSSLRLTHEQRPNNWGTHAGASRLAVALYLGERAEVDRIATVFHGWLGNRAVYKRFHFREQDWQAEPGKPVAINPAGWPLHRRRAAGRPAPLLHRLHVASAEGALRVRGAARSARPGGDAAPRRLRRLAMAGSGSAPRVPLAVRRCRLPGDG